MRYLDLHNPLSDDAPTEVFAPYKAMRPSLLLNIALAANKIGTTAHARVAIDATTRCINRLQLSSAEKGSYPDQPVR